MTANIAAAKAALSHLDLSDKGTDLRASSRDFFWYSPVLKEKLNHVIGDFIVRPRTEAEVIETLKICHQHNVPVTTRGAGTGNYGQAMPLRGGCIMHLRHMDTVTEISPGRVTCQPGVLLKDVDAACREHSGQELRMHASTHATATVGGFIAGGSGGVGSIRWGFLSDPGNILRLRVVTMEDTPRILTLTGPEIAEAHHAYGTTGIITEIEMPLAPAYDWVDLFLTAQNFAAATHLADTIGRADGVLLKNISVFEAPTAHSYFQRVTPHVQPDDHLIGIVVAPQSLGALLGMVAQVPEAAVIYRSDNPDWARGPGPVFEYGWNHTTLRALKFDPAITYLQVRYAFPDHVELVQQMRRAFSPEVLQHLEVIRSGGHICFSGLSLVKFTDEARLNAIIDQHNSAGALVYNPHRFTLEEGGGNAFNPTQINSKLRNDPKGLLNPGKMIGWDAPDWPFDRMYLDGDGSP